MLARALPLLARTRSSAPTRAWSSWLTVLLVPVLGRAAGVGITIAEALFQVVSIITTTGFASVDFQLWNDQAKMVLLVLMFVGGCAGSAAAGRRWCATCCIARYTRRAATRAAPASGPAGEARRPRRARDMGPCSFFLFYLLTFAMCTVIVVALGADMMTGITASIARSATSAPASIRSGRWRTSRTCTGQPRALTLAMWIGRLEVLTVLVLLRPEAWRSGQWSAASRRMA